MLNPVPNMAKNAAEARQPRSAARTMDHLPLSHDARANLKKKRELPTRGGSRIAIAIKRLLQEMRSTGTANSLSVCRQIIRVAANLFNKQDLEQRFETI